jgi:hypothetical protein
VLIGEENKCTALRSAAVRDEREELEAEGEREERDVWVALEGMGAVWEGREEGRRCGRDSAAVAAANTGAVGEVGAATGAVAL